MTKPGIKILTQNIFIQMKLPMDEALQIAQQNLKEIRTVTDWAEKMGYCCSKDFSRRFRNNYQVRPLKILNSIKSMIAIELLSETNKTVYEIGWCELGIGDEKAFWQFMKNHTGCSPRELRAIKSGEVDKVLEKLSSKIRE